MNILDMHITVDKLPDGCNVASPDDECCVFNCFKYCILKLALNREDCFVHNNRGVVPDDCPLRQQK